MSSTPVDVWAMADLTEPFAVRTVATLGVADVVKSGPIALKELARRCDAKPDPLGRVLRFLVHRGLFTEPEPDVFGPNDASRPLEDDAEGSIRGWLDLDGAVGRADLAFVELISQVRGHGPAYPAAFGGSFWEDLDHHPGLSDSYDDLMEAKSQEVVPEIIDAYDWTRFSRVADIGGGKGVLLAAILQENPSAHGILFDLPGPTRSAAEYLRERGVWDRAETVTGDFFDPLGVQADAVVLFDVLGDWDDDDAVRILTRCAEAAGEEGSILIIELSADFDDQQLFTEMDLRMMIYVGGRMRDLPRTRRITAAAGLFVADVTRLAHGYQIVECLPDR